ncbi:MAG: asparagine synthetase B, partial [Candidatus Electrothrix sp. LOE2]|nr:asparagine synthetase B [Candidatus Electrothrix sp. LOE2]
GDGGDELFGGYRHYQQPLLDQARLGLIPEGVLRLLAGVAAQLPAGVRGRNRLASLRQGLQYAHIWGSPYFDVALRKRIFHPDVCRMLGDGLDAPECSLLALAGKCADPTDSLMRIDFGSVLPDDFLVKVDRASMANSLEVRSPFLDYRLIEYAYSRIPSDWKVTATERRKVQHLMAKKYLPKGFALNRKQGFSIPMDSWMRNSDIRERLQGLPEEIIDRRETDRLVQGLMKGRTNGARLFALMMLKISLDNLKKV